MDALYSIFTFICKHSYKLPNEKQRQGIAALDAGRMMNRGFASIQHGYSLMVDFISESG